MDDQQLLRYGRQILLPQIGIDGQEKLRAAHVLVVGVGGLGSPVAMYLAASGIGHLTLVDHDTVELSNLQRQIVHTTERLGLPKVESAQQMLRALNPECVVEAIPVRLSGGELNDAVAQADVVIDASDNFATRFAVNRACVAARRPLVSGAVIRFEGQLTVFDARRDDSPCYRCLYPELDEEAETCTGNGVVAPLPGVIGSLQALETIKLVTGAGEPLTGKLLALDTLSMEWRTLRLHRDPDCPVCGK